MDADHVQTVGFFSEFDSQFDAFMTGNKQRKVFFLQGVKVTLECINTKSKPKPSRTKFKPPTLQEVIAYVQEKNYDFDPEKFYAYYASNGWRVGKNPMKCWHSACVTWQRSYRTGPLTNNKQRPYSGIKTFVEGT